MHARSNSSSSWIRIVAQDGFSRAAGVAGPFHATMLAGGALAGTGHLSFFASLFYAMPRP